MNHKIHIGLVEDQHLFREGMKAILSSWEDFEVNFESANGYSVIEKLKNCLPLPDVLLVDLSLPEKDGKPFDGVAVTDAVLNTYPEIKILILSVHNDENFIAELIEHGAHGYLVKDSDPTEVCEAVRAVYHNGSYVNQRALRAIQIRMSDKNKSSQYRTAETPLTKREIEVLELVCQQMTAEEIADKLFISVKTVNGHRNNLLQKTGSRNVAGLVIYAVKNSIISV